MKTKQSQCGHELHEAFHAFSEISERLTESYRDLEERVAILTGELASARSERLKQLAEKERLANRLQKLLDVLPGAIVVLNNQDEIQDYNPGAIDLFGHPLLGRNWNDIAKKVISSISDDGSYATLIDNRHISISSRPLENEPGRILLMKDDTDTRRLQEMLNRNQRLSAMGEMVARLAHQIRTPLASVMLYISHLNKPYCDETSKSQHINRIKDSLRQLDRMVNDMLVFARGGEFTPETVKIGDLLAELKQTIDPQLQHTNSNVSVENNSNAHVIEGSYNMLLGALINVSVNAIQASKNGVEIKIYLQSIDEKTIEISISDNGPGIDSKIQQKIFDPFFTARSGGTGLGLAVVRAVIQCHKGDIRVKSTPGEGAEFIITLPITQGEELLASGRWSDSNSCAPEYKANNTSINNKHVSSGRLYESS